MEHGWKGSASASSVVTPRPLGLVRRRAVSPRGAQEEMSCTADIGYSCAGARGHSTDI